VAVTGQQARDDDDIGAEVDTQWQHVRTPVHVLVLTGQNATAHMQRHRLKRFHVVVPQQGCNQGDYKGIYTPKFDLTTGAEYVASLVSVCGWKCATMQFIT